MSGGRSTTGATRPISFFAPHQAYSSRQRSARPGRRVPRYGQGARTVPASRSFSMSCSTTRPKATTRGQHSFRGIDNPTYYMLQDGGQVHQLHGAATHSTPTIRSCGDMNVDSLRYWVERNARRRIPLRLASILTRDAHGIRCQIRPCVGYRVGSGARRHQAHCRGVGRRRAVSSRQLRRRAWREWNGTFRDDVRDFFQRRTRFATARGGPNGRSPGSMAQASRERSKASTS